MALPVIPPPNGERFEGGYHVERNPINGALTLVEPRKGKHSKYPTVFEALNPKSILNIKMLDNLSKTRSSETRQEEVFL